MNPANDGGAAGSGASEAENLKLRVGVPRVALQGYLDLCARMPVVSVSVIEHAGQLALSVQGHGNAHLRADLLNVTPEPFKGQRPWEPGDTRPDAVWLTAQAARALERSLAVSKMGSVSLTVHAGRVEIRTESQVTARTAPELTGAEGPPRMGQGVEAEVARLPLLRATEDAMTCISRRTQSWTDGVVLRCSAHNIDVMASDSYHLVKSQIPARSSGEVQVTLHPELARALIWVLSINEKHSARPASAKLSAIKARDAGEEPDPEGPQPGMIRQTGEAQGVKINVDAPRGRVQIHGSGADVRWSLRGPTLDKDAGQTLEHALKVARREATSMETDVALLERALNVTRLIAPDEVQIVTQPEEQAVMIHTQGHSEYGQGKSPAGEARLIGEGPVPTAVVRPDMIATGLEFFTRNNAALTPHPAGTTDRYVTISPRMLTISTRPPQTEERQANAGQEPGEDNSLRDVTYMSTLIQ